MHRFRFLAVFTFVCFLIACSHAPTRDVPVSEGRGTPAPGTTAAPAPAPSTAPPSAPAATHGLSYRPPVQPQAPRQMADGAQLPAVQGLLAAAERALRSNELDLAAGNLERAQRLAPQSATVYQRLADVRLRQRRPAEAEQLARKALAYAGSPAQQAQLWRQIATARQQQGQTQSAHEALQRAAALESAGVTP